MRRPVLALVLVAATAATASAGGYVGLGIGNGANSSGGLSVHPAGRTFRLMGGYEIGRDVLHGRFAVEALGTRYDMVREDGHEYTGTTLALAGRYNFGLGYNFYLYARLGIQYTTLEPKVYEEPRSGIGVLFAPGVEYRIPIGAMALAFFIDGTVTHASMSDPSIPNSPAVGDLTSTYWTLGAAFYF